MLKNKKILIILITSLIVISIIVGLIFMGSKNKNIKVGGRDIIYINPQSGKDNKLAVIMDEYDEYERTVNDGDYIITIDKDYYFNTSTGYFKNEETREEGELFFKRENMSPNNFKAGTSESLFGDNYIKFEMRDSFSEKILVESYDKWVLVTEDNSYSSKNQYEVHFCLNGINNVEGEKNKIELGETICFSGITNSWYDKDYATKEFNNIKKIVNIYKVKEVENENGTINIEFRDLEENKVYLNDYRFVRDIVAESLFAYDIYIRDTKNIEYYEEKRIRYIIPKDENHTEYGITTCSEESFNKTKNKTEYPIREMEHNGKKYEIITSDNINGDLTFYTKINENNYICIQMYAYDVKAEEISDENIQTFIERIKQQLL